MLSLNNVEVIYDGVILVLKGVSINCPEGRITTLLGANGAGKTTTLKAISGLLRSERGEITKGSVELSGQRIDHMPPHRIVQRGIVQVFEGRRVFEHLTAEENLVAGATRLPTARASTRGSSGSTDIFRGSGSAATSRPDTCRAASSRCWSSGAR